MKSRGFTLIESVATMTIVSVILIGMVSIASNVLTRRQTQLTTDHMNEIRRAIAGNPVIVVNEARTSFGYVGDMGNVPPTLESLWVKPSGAGNTFTFDSVKKTGSGWNGPYLEMRIIETASALGYDGWGNAFAYPVVAGATTDSTFGALVMAKLLSMGPDFTTGTNDDLSINFFKAEILSRVQGYVRDSAGNGVSGVSVTVNYASSGVLASTSANADDTGYYAIKDIPFGNRSITVDPKLVLAPGTTVVSGNSNQNLEFTVKNFSSSNVSIAQVIVEINLTGQTIYFGQLKLGNDSFNYSPRKGSGDVLPISPTVSVLGTAQVQESIPIRLQSAITDVADLVIGDLGKGGSLTVQLNDFADATSGGNAFPINGVPFVVTFKDSSGIVIGTVAVTP